MKLVYTSLLLIIAFHLSGQKINIDPCAIFKEAMTHGNVDTLDHYLNMGDDQLEKRDRINLLTFKAATIIRKNRKRYLPRKAAVPTLVDSSYQLFNQAIDMVEDENLIIGYKYRLYETLKDINPSYPGLLADKEILESSGYKEDDSGFTIHLTSRYDGEFWLGAQASIFGRLQLPFHFKDGYGSTIRKSKYGRSASIFTFSYLRNLETNSSESKFSIFQVEAPVYIDITQFGFIQTDGKSYWFYRPEIGVGYGRFSLSYGVNIFFKKSARDIVSRHSLSF